MISIGLLIVRLAVGLTISAHGTQKVFGWFGGPGIKGFTGMTQSLNLRPARAWAWMAALSELLGGLLIATGLLNPIGSLVVMGTMMVAIGTVHLSKGFFASNGGYEFPLLIMLSSLAIAFMGPGVISVDGLLGINLPEPATFIIGLILVALGATYAVIGPATRARIQAQGA
jgi:putative oxidoreductase